MSFNDSEYPFSVVIRVLGGCVLVNGKYGKMIDGVKRYFSPLVVDDLGVSPDVVIWCDWPEAPRYLFRTRPGEDVGSLHGVHVQYLGCQPEPFRGSRQPIPPLGYYPFVGRFLGLHAAATYCNKSNKTAVIMGDRGAGKSTLCRFLAEEFGFSLLTDELTFVHNRSCAVEPFPIAVHFSENHQGSVIKTRYPSDEKFDHIATETKQISALISLAPGETSLSLRPLCKTKVVPLLMHHNRDVGLPYEDVMKTVYYLSTSVVSYSASYRDFNDLKWVAGEIGRLIQ